MHEYDYIVSFRGPLTNETRGALDDADGLEVSAGTGELPGPNRTSVRVSASDDIAAVARVEAMVAPTGAYGEFSVAPG